MNILINIDVPDIGQAIAFYEQGLGMTLSRMLFDNRVAEMSMQGLLVHLLHKPADTPATSAGERRRYDRHWTPLHLDFVVEDIDAATERAVTAGAVLEQPARERDWGKLALLSDPFGNGFCLVEFKGAPYSGV